jgi:hypothetical protein
VSPRIVSALLDGTAPAGLTVTTLARGLPYCWGGKSDGLASKQTAQGQRDRSPQSNDERKRASD